MELTEIEAKMAEAEKLTGAVPERVRLDRLGWDELTVEQKIERMRDIVKGSLHVHGTDGTPMMSLEVQGHGFDAIEARMPDGKVYF